MCHSFTFTSTLFAIDFRPYERATIRTFSLFANRRQPTSTSIFYSRTHEQRNDRLEQPKRHGQVCSVRAHATARLLRTVSSDTIYLVIANTASNDIDCQPNAPMLLLLKSLLVDRSPLFASALAKYASPSSDPFDSAATWLEDTTGVVRLPDDEFDVVEMYIKLLYTNEAPVQEEPDNRQESDVKDISPVALSFGEEGFPQRMSSLGFLAARRAALKAHEVRLRNALDSLRTLLSKLYVFCEKIQDSTSKELVLAAMIESSKYTIRDLQRRAHPGPTIINNLYLGTKPDDPMRRWLSDSAVCFGHSGWLQDGLEYHTEECGRQGLSLTWRYARRLWMRRITERSCSSLWKENQRLYSLSGE